MIVVKASIRSEKLNVKLKSDETKSSKIAIRASADFSSLKDEDLIELKSLENLYFEMKIEQTEKVFKPETPNRSRSDQSSDSNTRSDSSRTTESSERRR